MIYISSDHRGFELKEYLIKNLASKGIAMVNLGPEVLVPDDDYTDYALLVAKKIQENSQDKGILICNNGAGVSIMANRFKGIRASLSWNPQHAASTRNDDDTNILALPANFISADEALKIVERWLQTPFENIERRVRRLKKLDSL